ncbi:uncharacterized protein EV420DRAFT_979990 [Desarmillaria tabescens]|uniref:Uncharacterized protein n=1 Tax=Armillaria tabescens TaxID=1929756 RepID=A0AA39JMI7_ARMTA|nr:uncharacterized protein EV420DRAFT_979990 [Desarmillaria tabescens]KAK0445002.1 hypothetical protein EV420DRAFT_979990 [Desarmillaria tabescens]
MSNLMFLRVYTHSTRACLAPSLCLSLLRWALIMDHDHRLVSIICLAGACALSNGHGVIFTFA